MYPISSDVENLLNKMLQIKSTRRITMQRIKEYVRSIDTFFLGDEDLDESLWTNSNRNAAELFSLNKKNPIPPPVPPKPKVQKTEPEVLEEVDITCIDVRLAYCSASSSGPAVPPLVFSNLSPEHHYHLEEERAYNNANPPPLPPFLREDAVGLNLEFLTRNDDGAFIIGSISSDRRSFCGPITPQTSATGDLIIRVGNMDLTDPMLTSVNAEGGFWDNLEYLSDDLAPSEPPAEGKTSQPLRVRDFRRLAEARKQKN